MYLCLCKRNVGTYIRADLPVSDNAKRNFPTRSRIRKIHLGKRKSKRSSRVLSFPEAMPALALVHRLLLPAPSHSPLPCLADTILPEISGHATVHYGIDRVSRAISDGRWRRGARRGRYHRLIRLTSSTDATDATEAAEATDLLIRLIGRDNQPGNQLKVSAIIPDILGSCVLRLCRHDIPSLTGSMNSIRSGLRSDVFFRAIGQ